MALSGEGAGEGAGASTGADAGSLQSTITPLPGAPRCVLGESPVWLAEAGELWWCDIPGMALHRWHATPQAHRAWAFDAEPGCCAPLTGEYAGQWLLAMRDGLWRFDPANDSRELLAAPPYDVAHERFNDGRADALGRLWVGTIYEPREPPLAALYCLAKGKLVRVAGGITVSNGLAFSPDAKTLYWSDTKAHRISAFDFDLTSGATGRQRLFAQFDVKTVDTDMASYGGRPDGAAVDVEGAYWVAMFEGSRLLRLSSHGEVLSEVRLPVRFPTMPCFGGPDMRSLFITTASEQGDAASPWAGCVLTLRVDVPGLPVNHARLA